MRLTEIMQTAVDTVDADAPAGIGLAADEAEQGPSPRGHEEPLGGIVTVTDLLGIHGRGAQRPTARSQRAVLRGRGPRRKPFAQS